MLSVLTAFVLATACSSNPPASDAVVSGQEAARVGASARDPFPKPRQGLKLTGWTQDGGQSLAELLNEFSKVTGENLVIDKETRAALQATQVGLNQSLDVPPEEVYFVVETILAQNDVVLVRLSDHEPRMLGVYAPVGTGRQSLRGRATYVRAEELAAYARHPAFLITTMIVLPSTDVRTLSNSMRSMFVDANTQQIIPVGNSDGLILIGQGSAIANMVEMLRAVDDASRREFEKRGGPKAETPAPTTGAHDEKKPG